MQIADVNDNIDIMVLLILGCFTFPPLGFRT